MFRVLLLLAPVHRWNVITEITIYSAFIMSKLNSRTLFRSSYSGVEGGRHATFTRDAVLRFHLKEVEKYSQN